MSNSSSDTTSDHGDLEEIAARLYSLPPKGFAAARDEAIRKARAVNQQLLASELAKLRKPNQSAWLINLIWRNQQDVIEQLFSLAQDLGQAQASGSELQRLSQRRREIEAALARHARALAEKAGVSVSANMERDVFDTLAAAMACPEVADEVRSGRLVKPASYAGFGSVTAVAPSPKKPSRTAANASAAEVMPPVTANTPRPAKDELKEAQSALADARAAMKEAVDALAKQEEAVETASAHLKDLRKNIEDLELQLRDLKLRRLSTERAAKDATTQKDLADKAHAAAREELERAEKKLAELA